MVIEILRGFVSPKGRNLTTRGTGDHRDVRTERVVPVGVVQIVRRRIQALMLPEDTYNIILITGKHPHQTPNTNHQSPRDSSLTAERIFCWQLAVHLPSSDRYLHTRTVQVHVHVQAGYTCYTRTPGTCTHVCTVCGHHIQYVPSHVVHSCPRIS